jgi:ATP-dependent Zn protease
MGGFTGTENVIVLAAINRPEILDPGCCGRAASTAGSPSARPDQAGRRQILEVRVRGPLLADDVDLDAVASATPGMVGAELANLVNEAAILAARRGHDAVHQADFATPWSGSCSAASGGSCSRPRSVGAPPIMRPATPWSACSRPVPTRSARSR